MEYTYKTENTCSTQIKFNIDNNIVTNVKFENGCNGNLKAISSLVDGMTIDQIIQKCTGISCGRKNTSCADQLTKAVKSAALAIQPD